MYNLRTNVLSRMTEMFVEKKITIGNVIEICVLIITVTLFFAFIKSDTETLKQHDKIKTEQIEDIEVKVNKLQINQAVTNERYDTIIKSLGEIKKELKKQ